MIKKVLKQQNLSNQSLIVDLKTQFTEFVHQKKTERMRQLYLVEKTTCPKFENIILHAKEQCSQNEFLTSYILKADSGPLESYFKVMDLKMKVTFSARF